MNAHSAVDAEQVAVHEDATPVAVAYSCTLLAVVLPVELRLRLRA